MTSSYEQFVNDPQRTKHEKLMIAAVRDWYKEFGPEEVERFMFMWVLAVQATNKERAKFLQRRILAAERPRESQRESRP